MSSHPAFSLFMRCSFSSLAITAFGLLVLPAQLAAQWPGDPDLNLPVGISSGENVQPKAKAIPGGGSWISWLSSGPSGYDVYLQRLTADGTPQLGEDGLLIADRGLSSTEDYGLDVDAGGNAYLAFRDDRSGGLRITAIKVSPDGAFPWGENGVDVSGEADFVAAPRIITGSAGNSVVGYTRQDGAVVAAFNAEGDADWEIVETSSNILTISDMQLSVSQNGTENYVVSFRPIGPPTVPGILSAQSYTAQGETQWGTERITLNTTGNLQLGNFPTFISDGSGGAIFSWFQASPVLQNFVQHIDANGDVLLQEGGLPLSVNSTRLRASLAVSYDAATGDIYAFWRETDGGQNDIGLYGQRINSDGERAWGEDGIEIEGLQFNREIGSINTFLLDGEAVVAYSISTGTQQNRLLARKFDSGGDYVWEGDYVEVSSVASDKSRMDHAVVSSSEAFLAWEDSRNGSRDIYAQNLNTDGSLGESEEPDPDPEERTITFTVDMSVQIGNGVFQPETGDMLHVPASFNDWSASAENGTELAPSGDEDLWSAAILIEGDTGESVEYKYFIEAGDGRSLPNDGWEGNEAGPGENGNRVLELPEDNLELPVVFFDNDEGPPVSISDDIRHPQEIHLGQNYPNPFNPTTLISYELPESAHVRIEVYNSMGQRIMLMQNGRQQAGRHTITFDGSGLSSGMYFYRLQSASIVYTRKMMLIK